MSDGGSRVRRVTAAAWLQRFIHNTGEMTACGRGTGEGVDAEGDPATRRFTSVTAATGAANRLDEAGGTRRSRSGAAVGGRGVGDSSAMIELQQRGSGPVDPGGFDPIVVAVDVVRSTHGD